MDGYRYLYKSIISIRCQLPDELLNWFDYASRQPSRATPKWLLQGRGAFKDEEAKRLARNVVRITWLSNFNRKFIAVNASLDFLNFWLKLRLVLIEISTFCRGCSSSRGTWKCPVAIADRCTTKWLRAKQKMIMYSKMLPTRRQHSSSSANHLNHTFAPMSNRIVWLQKSKNYPMILWFPDLLSTQPQEVKTKWALWK